MLPLYASFHVFLSTEHGGNCISIGFPSSVFCDCKCKSTPGQICPSSFRSSPVYPTSASHAIVSIPPSPIR